MSTSEDVLFSVHVICEKKEGQAEEEDGRGVEGVGGRGGRVEGGMVVATDGHGTLRFEIELALCPSKHTLTHTHAHTRSHTNTHVPSPTPQLNPWESQDPFVTETKTSQDPFVTGTKTSQETSQDPFGVGRGDGWGHQTVVVSRIYEKGGSDKVLGLNRVGDRLRDRKREWERRGRKSGRAKERAEGVVM